MVHDLQRILTLTAIAVLANGGTAQAQKFFSDDPVAAEPKPLNVVDARVRDINGMYDFAYQSFRPNPWPPEPAGAVNSLGEVIDSAWFINRHGRRRLTREELKRGPGTDHTPVGPFRVTGAKTEGITPGFQMTDAKGRLYFVKPDPLTNPEMATAAEMIGSRFFYAIGYNTPENYLVRVKRSELSIDSKATITGLSGKPRPMTAHDLHEVLRKVPVYPDGSMRFLASYGLPGKLLGPFKYEGVRSDDPNDVVPHERRRDLRGLDVFCAWLNHTDAKAGNSKDALIEENGVHFIRHYLIDFGAILGSDSDMPKDARFGHEFMIPTERMALRTMFSFGFYSPEWERIPYPNMKSVGRFEGDRFDPEEWKSNYPNPAFLSRLPDDEYWAAKQVMAFRDDDMRAIVEAGEYSNSAAAYFITQALIKRRDKIGQVYFSKVLALDHFRVEDGELRFDDLLVKHGFAPSRTFRVAWSRFDNQAEKHHDLAGEASFRLPREWTAAPPASYYAALITAPGDGKKGVLVYLRKGASGAEVVGIERNW